MREIVKFNAQEDERLDRGKGRYKHTLDARLQKQ